MAKKFDGAAILALPMRDNDSGAHTVRGYLVALVRQVWAEDEGFSGKRPFGNSGWVYEIAEPLVMAGVVEGDYDPEDGLQSFDRPQLDKAIQAALAALESA